MEILLLLPLPKPVRKLRSHRRSLRLSMRIRSDTCDFWRHRWGPEGDGRVYKMKTSQRAWERRKRKDKISQEI